MQFAKNIVYGYDVVALTKAADLDAWLKCQSGFLSPMSTGYTAFCLASALGGTRSFVFQLVIHAWKKLPWCGPFTCDVESGLNDMIASLAAGVIFIVVFMQLILEITKRRLKKRRKPVKKVL
jgi:hypothetical protein